MNPPTVGPLDMDQATGLGDMLPPLVVSPSAAGWLLGLGPSFALPTDELRKQGL